MPYYFGFRQVRLKTTSGVVMSPGRAVLRGPYPTREALLHKSSVRTKRPPCFRPQAIRMDCGRASAAMRLSTPARIETSVAWEPISRAHRQVPVSTLSRYIRASANERRW